MIASDEPVLMRATFADAQAAYWARASLRDRGVDATTMVAPSGAFVLELLTEPFSPARDRECHRPAWRFDHTVRREPAWS